MTVGELVKYLKIQDQNVEVLMGHEDDERGSYRYIEINEVNFHISGYSYRVKPIVSLDN